MRHTIGTPLWGNSAAQTTQMANILFSMATGKSQVLFKHCQQA